MATQRGRVPVRSAASGVVCAHAESLVSRCTVPDRALTRPLNWTGVRCCCLSLINSESPVQPPGSSWKDLYFLLYFSGLFPIYCYVFKDKLTYTVFPTVHRAALTRCPFILVSAARWTCTLRRGTRSDQARCPPSHQTSSRAPRQGESAGRSRKHGLC